MCKSTSKGLKELFVVNIPLKMKPIFEDLDNSDLTKIIID